MRQASRLVLYQLMLILISNISAITNKNTPKAARILDDGNSSLELITDLFEYFEMPFDISYIILGAPTMALGMRFPKVSIFAACLIGGQLVTQSILSLFLNQKNQYQLVCIIIHLCCFLIGLALAAYCSMKAHVSSKLVLGCVTGIVSAYLISGIMMGFARRPLLPIAIFFVVVLSGCLGCFLHQVMRQYFYIATTSFIGSFMMFIGIGSLYGNYPKVLKFDGEITLSLHLYLYQTLLHTGLGMLIQSILPILS